MRARDLIDDDAGLSLVEILITIVIVGIAFAAILGGMVTSITVSDVHRKQATADTVVRSGAEAVKDLTVAYVSCAGPSAYESALPAAPSGYTIHVTKVEYWDGDGTSTDPVKFLGACPSSDAGLQRITLVAGSGDGRATETVQILKRVP